MRFEGYLRIVNKATFMSKKLFLFAIVLCCSFLKFNQAIAQTKPISIQSTAVPFMLISPDARSGGMGNLSLAMSPEANDLFGNNAKLPLLKEKKGFLINYTPWLKDLGLTDVYLASAGFYKKIDENSSINSSLRFFSLGNIQFSDVNGIPTTEQRPNEFSYDFGYSFLVSDQFSAGITLRYIHSKLVTGSFIGNAIDYRAGNTVSGDISLFYKQNEDLSGWHAGLLLSNLGGKISYSNASKNKYFIPANLGIGIGYLTRFDTENSIEFGADINRLLVPASPSAADPEYASLKEQYFSQSVINSYFNSFTNKYGMPIGESLKVSVGAEYNYTDRFFLRAGYFIDNNKNLGNMQYFTLGTSFQYQQSKFNISYLVPSGGGITKNPLSKLFL
jgi:hypothetical protein